jgi:hypothetical protein
MACGDSCHGEDGMTLATDLRGPARQLRLPMDTQRDEEFREWAASRLGQEILIACTRKALLKHAEGCRRLGFRMVWEVVRWEMLKPGSRDQSGFKANNNYHSRAARLIMDQHPELEGMFETRELKS